MVTVTKIDRLEKLQKKGKPFRTSTGWRTNAVKNEEFDFVHHWIPGVPVRQRQVLEWIGTGSSKFYDWEQRHDQENQHNAKPAPKIVVGRLGENSHCKLSCPTSKYRLSQLELSMLDKEVVAVSPSSVYRVLKNAGRLKKWN